MKSSATRRQINQKSPPPGNYLLGAGCIPLFTIALSLVCAWPSASHGADTAADCGLIGEWIDAREKNSHGAQTIAKRPVFGEASNG